MDFTSAVALQMLCSVVKGARMVAMKLMVLTWWLLILKLFVQVIGCVIMKV